MPVGSLASAMRIKRQFIAQRAHAGVNSVPCGQVRKCNGWCGVHVDALADGHDDRERLAQQAEKERRPLAWMRPYEDTMAFNGRHIVVGVTQGQASNATRRVVT